VKGVLFLIKSTITILDSSVSKYSSFLHMSPTSTSTKKRYLYLFVILYMFCYIPYIWLRFENLLRGLTSHVMWHDQPCYVAWPAMLCGLASHIIFIIFSSKFYHIIVIWLSYDCHIIVILLSYYCHNIVIYLSGGFCSSQQSIYLILVYKSALLLRLFFMCVPTGLRKNKIFVLFFWSTKVKGGRFLLKPTITILDSLKWSLI
jgi:hypothetical protein